MGLSDFPHPYVAVVLLADSQRGPRCHSRTRCGTSRLPCMSLGVRAQGLGPRGGGTALAITICSVLPSVPYDAVGPPKFILLSRLNIQPARLPVNASPLLSRTTTHDSGPIWFATPSLGGTCTRETYRFVPAHRHGLNRSPSSPPKGPGASRRWDLFFLRLRQFSAKESVRRLSSTRTIRSISASSLRSPHTAVLPPPLVERRVRHSVFTAKLRHSRSRFRFTLNPDDLLFRESLTLHDRSSSRQVSQLRFNSALS